MDSAKPKSWCIVVRPADTASAAQRESLAKAFARRSDLDWGRHGSDWRVRTKTLDDPHTGEPAVTGLLTRADLLSAVVSPFPVGRWNDNLSNYIVVDDEPEGPPDPVVPPEEIAWGVSVRPVSAFDWRAMKAELVQRGRITIRESGQSIEVGARDESDAQTLIDELIRLPSVGAAEGQPLGRIRRWKVQQQLLGNYEGMGDPSQSVVDATNLF
jgi:hypothetical protein